MKQQELLYSLLRGMQNGSVTFEGRFAVSYKGKHTFTILSNDPTPWFLPKGVENFHSHKISTWMFIATLFIHNYQNLEAIKISLGRCMVKSSPGLQRVGLSD